MTQTIKCLVKAKSYIDAHGNKIPYHAIYETTIYQLLEFLNFNRAVLPAHKFKMNCSISKFGVCRDVVVVQVGKKMYVVDGQHLYSALEDIATPIRFKLVNVDTVNDALQYMIALNDTSKNWSLTNFVDAWSKFNDGCTIIKELKSKCSLTTATIAALLCDCSVVMAKKLIREGNVKVADKDTATRKVLTVQNFFTQTKLSIGARGIEGLINYMGNIGFDTYMKEEKVFIANILAAMAKNPKLKSFASWKEYTDFFIDCRNNK